MKHLFPLSCLRTWHLLAFLVFVSPTLRIASAAELSFDLRPAPRARTALSAARQEDGILRETHLAAGAAKAAALAVGDSLAFQLFDGVSLRLTLAERTESPLGGETFLARVDGPGHWENAAVMQTPDGLLTDVWCTESGLVYRIVSTAASTVVTEIDPTAGVISPCETLVPDIPASAERRGISALSDQPPTLVDVLVAYDTGATAWADQNGGGITNFANMAVQKMNTALANSGLGANFRFRLVGVTTLNASATDVHTALDAISNNETGWAAVKTARDEVGADIVATLIDTGSAYGTTGLGWSLKTASVSSFSESAYNVCAIRSVAQSHTMTHEVGHNMGAGHATAVNPAYCDPGPQLYDYSAGYYFTGTDNVAYHTIMAYNEDGFGNHHTEAPLFSSPDIVWEGTPAGDATHDNALTIRNTYAGASAWRSQVIPMSYDVFFSPDSGATFADSLTVTLIPGKAGLPIRYTLDGSAPTLSSPLYSTPIILTATTTIRAATVTDGVLGPVYEATYSVSDLGNGVDAPQLVWTTSPDYPWVFQTTSTYDGVDAVQSGEMPDQYVNTSWLKTTITGPTTMSFRYRKTLYASTFSVKSDSVILFSDEEQGYQTDWMLVEAEIPDGTHEVTFSFQQRGYYNDFDGIWLDQIRFDALSRPPTMSPTTTTVEATATVFTNTLTVTLAPPAGCSGALLYTLDGSDPAGEYGLPYEGPITLTDSTLIRSVFVEPGKDPSTEASGLFLERHPVGPGEWTTDVAGVKATAAQDGRLICVLLASLKTCTWSQRFNPIAESEAFLAWARMNGIYLVSADTSRHIDANAAYNYFWQLHGGGSVDYPTFYFALPSAPNTKVGTGIARNDGSSIGSVPYVGTVESLIAGIASVLGGTVPDAPIATPDAALVDAFPVSIALTTPTLSGNIYYTLDGTDPTPENGMLYTEPISVGNAGITLQAAVWTTSGHLSSPVLVRTYQTVSDWANGVFGTSGLTWSMSGDVEWETASDGVSLRTGGLLNGSTYASTLTATATGKGTFVFTYKIASLSWQNTLAFSLGGNQQWSYGFNGNTVHTGTITTEVTDSATFSWTYAVGDPSRDYSANYSTHCGAWLSDVRWIPEATATSQGVPYTWIDTVFPSPSARDAAAYEAVALADEDGDGYANWEEYVWGTDAGVSGDKPQCSITMSGDVPVITHNVDIPDAAAQAGWTMEVRGSTDLRTWAPADMTTHTFFKVVVTRPED